jgi:hypothetical protein
MKGSLPMSISAKNFPEVLGKKKTQKKTLKNYYWINANQTES